MRSLAVGARMRDWIRFWLLARGLGPFMSGRVVESLRGWGRARARTLRWAVMRRVGNNMVENRARLDCCR